MDNSDLSAFFDKVDKYLIEDIKSIFSIPAKRYGRVAYPCLQTIVSGMELIGMIMSGKEGDDAYYAFWQNLK